jgi:SOS response regulatory protein OraA/RecX
MLVLELDVYCCFLNTKMRKCQRDENEHHMERLSRELQERGQFVNECNIIVQNVNRNNGPFKMTLSEFLQMFPKSFQEMDLIDIATYLAVRAHFPEIQFSESVCGMDSYWKSIRKELMTRKEVEEEITAATIKITDTSKIDKAIQSAFNNLRNEHNTATDWVQEQTVEFLENEAIKEYIEDQVMSSIRRQASEGARMGYLWGPSNHVWVQYPIWI